MPMKKMIGTQLKTKTSIKDCIKKAAAILAIAGTVLMASMISPDMALETKAAGTLPTTSENFDVFIDANNNVCIVTNDKIKDGSIYYRTIGFSISRGKFNPSEKKLANGAGTEYFELPIRTSEVETYNVGRRQINVFKYPYAELKSHMSAAWQQELEDADERGMTAYIRFDAIMVIYHGRIRQPGLYVNNPIAGPNDNEATDRNPRELQRAETWSAGANTGIRSHFHRWLPISSHSAIIPDTGTLTDWHITKQETLGPGVGEGTSELTYYGDYTGAPEYAGGNANLEGYDAGYGVPSTKTITGYAESSPWYGNVDVWARLVSHQYKKTDTYEWRVDKEDKGADLTTTYDGSPIKDTGSIRSTVNKAFDAIYAAIRAEEARLTPLLAKFHDTDLNDIFTYTVKLKFVDDAGNVLANTGGTDGEGAITITVNSRSVTRTVPIPMYQNGWEWTEKHFYDEYEMEWDGETYEEEWTGNYNEDGSKEMVPDYDRPHYEPNYDKPIYRYEPKSITWKAYNDPLPKPDNEYIVAGPTATYTNGSLVYCGWKLEAKVVRKYFDDHNNVQEDRYVQAYASFNYIDPYKTNVYDLNSVTLYNDIYGSVSFPQVVDTEMDAQKGSITTNNTVPFDSWLSANSTSASISSEKIATNDYIKWAEIEDEEKGKLLNTYKKDDQLLKEYISANTKSVNDHVFVKNPIDLGPADGVYLGGKASAGYGIVTGCDFRDAENMPGYTSISLAILSGNENVVTGSDVYEEGNEVSKYWYLCKHTAGANEGIAHAYITNNQSKLGGVIQVWEKLGYQTVPIEPKTANGSHSTGISTLYVQEIIGPTTATSTEQYADELSSGHLYSPTGVFGSSGIVHGYSKWGGVMGSAEGGMDESGFPLSGPGSEPSVDGGDTGDVSYIVDPVQIHTPIMSPGTIYNPSGKETSRDAHENNVSPVTGDRTPTSTTNLYKDLSADGTSQLRLDSYYYIKWQDLSDLAKTHRQTATPDDGGFASQTDNPSTQGLEEDQFTNAKYFKFPFEVMYDGKYYKPNQWIKVRNPNESSDEGEEEYNDNGYLRDANPHVAGEGSDIPGELISENHWVYTPFYIPSWATEGLFEEIDNPDGEYRPRDLTTCAQLRVDAINVTAEGESRADQIQELANTYYNVSTVPYDDGAAYVAQFNYPVQLSGWIYDFTITGVSDVDTFTVFGAPDAEVFGGLSPEEMYEKIESTDLFSSGEYSYSFTANKQDKKSGLLNRLGYKAVRYLKDGKVNSNWNEQNTVALVGAWKKSPGGLHNGKSNAWYQKGTVVKGTTFSFTLKTMSNMWNFNNKDSIQITPDFTYHKFDSATNSWTEIGNDNLKIYYDADDNNVLIPFGSNRDMNVIRSASLGDTQFDQSYYTGEDTVAGQTFGDWIWYNTYMYDLKYGKIPAAMTFAGFKEAYNTDPESLVASGALVPEDWLGTKIDEYCMSAIVIPERMRLLSGEADQLMFNIYGNGRQASNLVTPKDLAPGSYGEEFMTHFNSDNELETVGATPKIVINNAEESITMDNKVRYSIQSWYGRYYVPQELYVVDLNKNPKYRDFSDPRSDFYPQYITNGGFVYGYELGDPTDDSKYYDYMEYHIVEMYKNNSSVTEEDKIFIQDGFLAVNFDILAVKNGEPHLIYDGGNIGEPGAVGHEDNKNNSWKTENYPEIPDDIDPPVPTKTDEGVPTDKGDVVVVDLSEKFKDRFNAALYNIN